MSSYVSGYYDIRAEIIASLRAKATQELRAIESEAAQLQAQHDAEVSRRQALQAGYLSAEGENSKFAHEAQVNAQTRQLAIEQEAELLLAQATARIEAMEDVPEKQGMLESLADMLSSVDKLGVTSGNIEHIRKLVRETIPAALLRIHEQQEKERIEQELRDRVLVKSTVTDQSIDFVSMKVGEQQKKQQARPWDLFVSRVRAMAAAQDEFGGFGAEDMLEEIESVAPGMQNLFMMQNE